MLFYKLNGFNEPTLKHVFLASLPEELQPDIQRQLTASNLSLDNISLGKIFQLAKTCLDKLCEQKQFFKELLKDKEPFRSACKKPYLQIKCHKKKDCDCDSKKKRHFRKFKNPEFSSKPRRSRKPYRFFRKKSPSTREFKRKQSSRCFICKRKGHYAKDCPNKREKSIRLVEHLQATTDYSPTKDELEFYFSEQDEPNDETVFALQNSSDSDSDQSQVIFHQQLLSLDTTVPIPSIKLHILPSKFQRPITAIGLIDTGTQRNMLNPHLLPSEYWTQSKEHFKAVNGKLFTTSLITKKPIGIQIFPNCVIWTKVIGSTLPNKDILLGFDILHQIRHLQIIPTGIRVKSMFKPFTHILKLYHLSETPQSYQDISTRLLSFCPESHSEFTHPNPLWKNKSFFIKLPFKLNEDINPTKATHPGMSPSDLLLAQQECSQLLAQGSHVDHHTHHLSALLKKQPPEWNADHTAAVTTLKQIAQNLPPLKLITDGKRILQTDAGDESWGAILLEELNDKEHFIAYASGHFSETQKHYHNVFKEILADPPPNLPNDQLSHPKLTKPPKLPLTILQSVLPETIIALIHHAVVPLPFYTPSTSRQPVDYAKFFGLSHLKNAPTTAPPKPRSRPPKPEPPPIYHQPSDPQSSPEPQSTQKNKEPMHQYSSQVLPHLLESNETPTDEESFSSESFSSSSNSEKSFTDISKLLMVQPSTGSNDPSPSLPPQTHMVEEADSDTNPILLNLPMAHGLLLMTFQE
ncbi:hypothetical protein KPL71_004252 [Citrus sinensis]|uniref:Uncharacterized protein n=1 Tax=Citrus sinensis TaxID=2711 RepID=A0ACB8N5T7_CITSI|nr:hypothetical protein KPL71_004252 [Citrus sinensis]